MMSGWSEDEVLEAVEQAAEEHDVWLAHIGTGSIVGVHEAPHPFAGLGAPAREVAEVLFCGESGHSWWARRMVGFGITSFAQLPFEEGRELADRWVREMPLVTCGQQSSVVHALRRLEGRGLVGRTAPGGGHAYWTLTEAGDRARAVFAGEGVA